MFMNNRLSKLSCLYYFKVLRYFLVFYKNVFTITLYFTTTGRRQLQNQYWTQTTSTSYKCLCKYAWILPLQNVPSVCIAPPIQEESIECVCLYTYIGIEFFLNTSALITINLSEGARKND